MEIQNLSNTPTKLANSKSFHPAIMFLILTGIGLGFGLSRLTPNNSQTAQNEAAPETTTTLSTDNISSTEQLAVGKLYGNTGSSFSDTATGVVKKGGINGEGTHTLERPGGTTQNAALTSSAVDLDLFIDKKVQVNGQTNRSNKASWFMDVGTIKILE